MAGKSEKKENKEKSSKFKNNLLYILLINGFLAISYLYAIYFNEYLIEKFDVISVVILNLINFICYRLLITFYKSMFYDYFHDIFIINLGVNLFLSFSRKAWYIYLLIPGYLTYKVGMYAYQHVKNLDKQNSETTIDDSSAKPKSKILKYNR